MDFVRHSISRFLGAPGRSRLQFSALLLRLSLVFVLFSTLNVQAAFSQEGSPDSPAAPVLAWNVQTVDATPYFANMTSRALAFKANNQPCAAYGGDGLYYTCYISPTGWTPTTIIDNNRGVGEYASLTYYYDQFWPEIRPAITYYDSPNGRLKLAYTLGGVWQVMEVPTLIPPYTAKTAGQDIGLTTEATLQKKQQHWKGLLPGEATLLNGDASPGVGKYSSIDLDELGGFHISYYDEFDDTLMYMYSSNPSNPNSWVSEVVDDYHDQGDVGLWSSIQVDPYLDVHIAYMSEKYDGLKYAFRNHAKPSDPWTVVTVDSANNVGSMGSLALSAVSSSGVTKYIPHISYLDFELDNLKYAKLIDLKTNQWLKHVVDSVDITGWWTSIAVDGSGKVHISYYNATKGDLKYAVGKDDSWNVSTAQKVDTVGWFTSIALNPANGNPGILYYNATTGWLQYTAKTNNSRHSWTDPQTVNVNSSASRDVGKRSSLALNGAGVPFISYLDQSSGFMKYSRAYGTNFIKYYPYSAAHSGLYSSIQVVDNYKPRIAFYDSDHGDLRYGAYNGFSWVFHLVDGYYDFGQYASLQISSAGIPQISYYDATNKNLMYAIGNIDATDWTTYTLDSAGEVGKYTSLVLNPANLPFVSYYDETNGDLKLTYRTGTGWEITTVDENGGSVDDVGRYTSIALDSFGNPHISYYDYTDGDLMYAYWQGGSFPTAGVWVKDHLTHVGGFGEFVSSLKIHTDDTRHLCYLDYTGENGKLMYLRYAGGPNWDSPQTVDSSYDVGYDCSLDLTGAGEPAITYYDRTGGDLKIALSYALPLPIYLYTYFPVISSSP